MQVFWFCDQRYLELDIHVVEDACEDCVGHNSNKDNDREDSRLWKVLAINLFVKIYEKNWLIPLRKDFPRDSKSAKWANERLDELLGYGRYQKFQAWVFIGLVSFVGKGTKKIGWI